MKTVMEVSRITGVSVRTLHYYDRIGLLHPARYTESGYRLYGETELERLQQILLFRELQFPLKEIRAILDRPDFDPGWALEQQIALLELKKERLEKLISFARELKTIGGKIMDFSAFDTEQLDIWTRQARERWGTTAPFEEFKIQDRNRTDKEKHVLIQELMALFAEFGSLRGKSPDSEEVRGQVEKLRQFISDHFYSCSPEMLIQLSGLYAEGGTMTENIDRFGGDGTAAFTAEAIRACYGA